MNKKDFVQKCGELLAIAKPHLVTCSYEFIPFTEDEFVVVTCENGYKYKIDVTASSLNAIAAAIFNAMAHK